MLEKNVQLAKALFAGILVSYKALQSAHAGGSNHYVRESVEVADHHFFGTSDRADGATSLIRNFRHQMVQAHISTKALERDTAYSK